MLYTLCMGIATREIRERALAAYEAQKGTQEEIAMIYGVSLRTFQRWYRQFRQTGSTAPKKRGHRQAVYQGKDLRALEKAIRKRPDATLEELRGITGKSCSIMAVQRAVLRLGYRYKKNSISKRTKST